MEIFTQRLKELRKEGGLTQKQLAEVLETTDDSIFSWEKGRSQPSIETLQKICNYFNVSADYLIGLKND
ncbi:MAG: helix-turn-helix transcriptional regulator [Clostridia bacterium]|nr:helix-turn-helix transcriptional regulator [Clostridia bacterium]